MIDKKLFKLIFPLTKNQPWLAKRIDELSTLLINDCTNKEQQLLVLRLLENFTYITNTVCGDILEKIVNKITDKYEEDSTIIVAMSIGSTPDSSQYVIYQMKPSFQEFGWTKPFLINSVDKIIREVNKKKKIQY